MEQSSIWFVLIAVLWTGFLALEGFDFGVGMLVPILGRDHHTESGDRRRVMLTAIGPHWDGNEVWLITAVGSMFAAFPAWYATTFSALYLPTLLLLLGLIARGVGLEYRQKRYDPPWLRRCDLAITGGSAVATAVTGLMLTALVRGLPLDADRNFVGTPASAISLASLLGAITFVALAITHGALFLALKTRGSISTDARALAHRLGWVTLALVAGLCLWLSRTGGTAIWVLTSVCVISLITALWANRVGRNGLAFAGTMVTWIALGASYFVALSPNLIPTTLTAGADLTIAGAASSPQTLQIITVAALAVMPIMVGYTAYSYWVFRRRISASDLPVKHAPPATAGRG